MCRRAQDISVLGFSPLSSESRSPLGNEDTKHTISLEVLRQLCGFFLSGSCVLLGGCGSF